jgi:PhnB protein
MVLCKMESFSVKNQSKKGVLKKMAIDVYLNFNGNCREAAEFYAEVFGTEKPQIMTFGEAPPDPSFNLPDEAKNLVMHTRLTISGSTVMFSDVFPGMPFVQGNNISLSIVSENLDEVRTWFNKLKEGGKVGMDLQETFWSKCYGNLTDKFGMEWQISYGSGDM